VSGFRRRPINARPPLRAAVVLNVSNTFFAGAIKYVATLSPLSIPVYSEPLDS
jgi:hypothetical protein